MHSSAVIVLFMLLVGCVVGMGARWVRLPYTLALVVTGIGLGFVEFEPLTGVALTGDVLFTFLLPALLFEAAYHMDARDFARSSKAILLLAVPGVLIAAAVSGLVAYGLIGMTGLREFGWIEAALFASVLAATDPISVLALFRELGVSRELYLLVEGESLVNDGVAVVVFLIVAAVAGVDVGHGGHGGHVDLHTTSEIAVYGLRTFAWMAGGGVLIGVLMGLLAGTVSRQIDDRLVEVTITTVVAYGSFLGAEEFGCSGVLATVAAGVATGSFGAKYGMSTRTRLAVEDFWEYAAFLANTFVFLLVGLELQIADFVSDILPIALGFVAMVTGRAAAVAFAAPLAGARAIPRRWAPVLVWGGLRGSLSMVLIIALPVDFPGRELLVHIVFGVVSASLFLQGLTVSPLLASLGLSRVRSEAQRTVERSRASVLAATQALHRLEALRNEGLVVPAVYERLHGWYDKRRVGAMADLQSIIGSDVMAERVLEAALTLAEVEREALRHAVRIDVVSAAVVEGALAELDERAAALRHAAHHGITATELDRVLDKT